MRPFERQRQTRRRRSRAEDAALAASIDRWIWRVLALVGSLGAFWVLYELVSWTVR